MVQSHVYDAPLNFLILSNPLAIDAADIPQARGLGSSAVCIVAGAVAANAFLNNRFSKAELLDLCTELEGHPDNVAPAIYGALCVSFLQDGHVHTMRYQMDSDWKFCAIIPDKPLQTLPQ